jgi:hypothetical protein
VAGVLGALADRKDREASAVEGVSGVSHLDHFRIELRWVLEGGITLLSRSTWSSAVGKRALSC